MGVKVKSRKTIDAEVYGGERQADFYAYPTKDEGGAG